MTAIEPLTPGNAGLGESPLWHLAEQVLYWVDINAGKVFRHDPADDSNRVVFAEETVTALAELAGGGLVLVTSDRLATLRDGEAVTMVDQHLPDGVRTNDGKADPRGRVWFGTMDLDATRPLGELFVYDGEAIRTVKQGVILSNGLGWSPSGEVFYHIDTTRRHLYRHDFDGVTGAIGAADVLVDMNGVPGVPDGLAVDVGGNIWVAMYDGWRIDVFDPSGIRVHQVSLDVQKPTSVAFGGGDRSHLYITTASQHLTPDEIAAQPFAGKLLRIDTETTGLPVGVVAPGPG
jgi:sugar lactone lactonase YvrE